MFHKLYVLLDEVVVRQSVGCDKASKHVEGRRLIDKISALFDYHYNVEANAEEVSESVCKFLLYKEADLLSSYNTVLLEGKGDNLLPALVYELKEIVAKYDFRFFMTEEEKRSMECLIDDLPF